MSKIDPDNQQLRSITLDDVVSYLLASNWKNVDHLNDRLLVFEGPNDDNGEPIKLILPRTMAYQDSYIRLAEAINLVAAIQEKSAYKLVEEIACGTDDQHEQVLLGYRDTEIDRFRIERLRSRIKYHNNLIEQAQDHIKISVQLFHTKAKEWGFSDFIDLLPASIPEHTYLARTYFYSGVIATILGALLVSILFSVTGTSFWIIFLLALLFPIVIRSAILLLCGEAGGSLNLIKRIKKTIIIPSSFLALAGTVITSTIRYTNIAPVNFLSLLMASQLIASIALLVMSGGLLALSSIWSWSKRAEREYLFYMKDELELRRRRDSMMQELNILGEVLETETADETESAHIRAGLRT
jgi:hypothetical protein